MFADDTMGLYTTSTTAELEEMLQYDTNLLAEWFYSSYLSISALKTRLMNFSLRAPAFEPQIFFNGSTL